MKQVASGWRAIILVTACLLTASLFATRDASSQTPTRPLIGLDHVPTAVKNLEMATQDYGLMGFAFKPGRFHENGIRNNHVKFPDGSGIELLTATQANDWLTTHYLQVLAQGEGPSSLALHARDIPALIRALRAGKVGYSEADGYLRPTHPALKFIFFVGDNRAKNDRPEHFAHPNSAVAMTEVWLATDEIAPFRKLLTALGCSEKRETVFVPEPVNATVFTVTNGKLILLPKTYQLMKGRPIVGTGFRVASFDALGKALGRMPDSGVRRVAEGGVARWIVPPQSAHGMSVAFSEAQVAEDRPAACDSCTAWNAPREPFRIFGNTYYVGMSDLSAVLIAGRDGLILLDGGLPQSARRIAENVTKLGFRVEDIELIVNSHAHWDHAGGIAALQRASGAVVAASTSGAAALKRGGPGEDDPQFAFPSTRRNGLPRVPEVRSVADGETLRVAELAITAHLTPGHTPGSTTWTWRSCEGERCLDIVYADSLSAVAAPGFKFTEGGSARVDAFARSIATVEKLPCDVLITPHSWDFDLDGKLKRRVEQPGVNAFIQPDACQAYAARARQNLQRRVDEEKASASSEPRGD
jgi:metallo-beta-lactamase class B